MFLTEILLILNYFEKNVQKFQIFETVVNLLPEKKQTDTNPKKALELMSSTW